MSLSQHESEQAVGLSAQRQAHAEFLPAKRNKIGEYAIDTNHSER